MCMCEERNGPPLKTTTRTLYDRSESIICHMSMIAIAKKDESATKPSTIKFTHAATLFTCHFVGCRFILSRCRRTIIIHGYLLW